MTNQQSGMINWLQDELAIRGSIEWKESLSTKRSARCSAQANDDPECSAPVDLPKATDTLFD
jgi:hypothetical protein